MFDDAPDHHVIEMLVIERNCPGGAAHERDGFRNLRSCHVFQIGSVSARKPITNELNQSKRTTASELEQRAVRPRLDPSTEPAVESLGITDGVQAWLQMAPTELLVPLEESRQQTVRAPVCTRGGLANG